MHRGVEWHSPFSLLPPVQNRQVICGSWPEWCRRQQIVSKNNILHCRREKDRAIHDAFQYKSNDFDYDLVHGNVEAREDSEAHGIRGIPQYETSPGKPPALRPGTPGHDAGCRLMNFNDGFGGTAPDMGAAEEGNAFPIPPTWPDFPELFEASGAI